MIQETIKKALPTIALLVLGIFLLLVISIVRTSVFGEVEEEKHIYFEIVFLLLLAVVGELVVVYTKQPTVMILMVLGVLLSPSFLSISWEFLGTLNLPFSIPANQPIILRFESVISVFAQLGAIVLLFKVGMHNKIEKIFAFDNLFVASAGVVIPFVVGYFYAISTGGSFVYSMFVAAALTATSVGVTVAILKEFKLMSEHFAEIIIGAAVLDDILALLVLSFVINITGVGGQDATAISLITTFITAIVFLAGAVISGNYFVKYLDKKELDAKRFLMVLALVLFYSYIAEFIRLSAIVGAFMAGIILNSSRHNKEIEEKTYGLEMLFMPIFLSRSGC